MKKEVLKGESELEANILSSSLESLSSCCLQVWEGLCCLVKRNSHQQCPRCFTPKPLSPQDEALWEPWSGIQPTYIPSTLLRDFGQQEEEQLQPLSSFPGKGLGIHITVRRLFVCRVWRALPFKSVLWSSSLWHPVNEKHCYNYKLNLVFFLRFPSQWLINILSNGTLLMMCNQRKKLKLYIPF